MFNKRLCEFPASVVKDPQSQVGVMCVTSCNFFVILGIFILLSRESDQSAITSSLRSC